MCDKMPLPINTREAVMQYLPTRVKTFVKHLKNGSVTDALLLINNDPDLNSSLFIIDPHKPYRIIGFGHPGTLGLQSSEIIGLNEQNSIADITAQIVATAKTGVHFITYRLITKQDKKVHAFAVYTQMIQLQQHNYAVGVSLNMPIIPENIIFKQRVAALTNIINHKGWPTAQEIINNYPESQFPFFVMTLNYPYRWLAINTKKLLNLTAQEGQENFFPRCTDDSCNIIDYIKREVRIVKKGGGFIAHSWVSDTGQKTIKIAYVEPVRIEGQACFIGTSCNALWIPWKTAEKMKLTAQRYKKMFEEIGINNTVTIIKKENIGITNTFVMDIRNPYKTITGVPDAKDSTLYDMVLFAEKESGFFAYPANGLAEFLQVAYITLVTIHNRQLCIVCAGFRSSESHV